MDNLENLAGDIPTPTGLVLARLELQQERFVAKPLYDVGKRVLESSIAFVILVGLAPLWLIIALLIKFTSPGPVLFKGRVVGKNGREFTYYKFRSMYFNNDDKQHRQFIKQYVQNTANGNRPLYKLTGDKRVTKVGQFIRRLSLDEVPQLWNVLRGEMAIVGPRPPLPYEYELYNSWSKQRLAVLPGITGLAQVRARNKASFQQMVEIDLEYISHRNLGLDLQIMICTPLVMLKGV